MYIWNLNKIKIIQIKKHNRQQLTTSDSIQKVLFKLKHKMLPSVLVLVQPVLEHLLLVLAADLIIKLRVWRHLQQLIVSRSWADPDWQNNWSRIISPAAAILFYKSELERHRDSSHWEEKFKLEKWNIYTVATLLHHEVVWRNRKDSQVTFASCRVAGVVTILVSIIVLMTVIAK